MSSFMMKVAHRLLQRDAAAVPDFVRSSGFLSLDAYVACARRRLLLKAADGGEVEVPTGVLRVEPDRSSRTLFQLLERPLRNAGMTGEEVGPIVFAEDPVSAVFSGASLGLIHQKNYMGPGHVCLPGTLSGACRISKGSSSCMRT